MTLAQTVKLLATSLLPLLDNDDNGLNTLSMGSSPLELFELVVLMRETCYVVDL